MNKELSIYFGQTIKALRVEKNLSQEELAFRSEVHRTYIGMVERGERNVTLESISKISRGLDVSMEEIFRKLNNIV